MRKMRWCYKNICTSNNVYLYNIIIYIMSTIVLLNWTYRHIDNFRFLKGVINVFIIQ